MKPSSYSRGKPRKNRFRTRLDVDELRPRVAPGNSGLDLKTTLAAVGSELALTAALVPDSQEFTPATRVSHLIVPASTASQPQVSTAHQIMLVPLGDSDEPPASALTRLPAAPTASPQLVDFESAIDALFSDLDSESSPRSTQSPRVRDSGPTVTRELSVVSPTTTGHGSDSSTPAKSKPTARPSPTSVPRLSWPSFEEAPAARGSSPMAATIRCR